MFALDTNLFMFPGPRRLLSGIAHVTGQPIGVLPQVERELIDNQNLAKAEAHRWAGKSKRQGNPVQKTKQAYRSLVHPTVKQWFYQHLLQQPIFERLRIDQEGRERVEEIADSLPTSAFHGASTLADQTLIAEAVYLNVPLLGSRDTNTITHQDVNDWAYTRGYNQPLIRSPSELVLDLCDHQTDLAYQWVMAFNSNRIDLRPPENREAFIKTLKLIGQSGFDEKDQLGFDTLVSRLKGHLDRDEDFDATFQDAIRTLSTIRQKILSSENELHIQVNMTLQNK